MSLLLKKCPRQNVCDNPLPNSPLSAFGHVWAAVGWKLWGRGKIGRPELCPPFHVSKKSHHLKTCLGLSEAILLSESKPVWMDTWKSLVLFKQESDGPSPTAHLVSTQDRLPCISCCSTWKGVVRSHVLSGNVSVHIKVIQANSCCCSPISKYWVKLVCGQRCEINCSLQCAVSYTKNVHIPSEFIWMHWSPFSVIAITIAWQSFVTNNLVDVYVFYQS